MVKTTKDFNEYCDDNKIPTSGKAEVLKKVQKEHPEFMLDKS